MKENKKLNQQNEPQHELILRPLENILHDSMMPYSEYVILDRALPRVEDGLKPVQRRILYSMLELGLTPDKPHRKSARIVGDCLGKYHPHGDTSVYDAMVRLAQPFNMRMPLVNGHGNFGSPDGDGAAAMRYTEARLEPLAMELLRDLDKNTVNWSKNFDDTRDEPDTLPGRFPNLLVNGASGIAIGLATSIPPHNLGEVIDGTVALIDNPNTTLINLMKIIKGPDFPTGAFVTGGEELFSAYNTGRGKLIMRAKYHVEGGDGEKKQIVITEVPYQVDKSAMLMKVRDLRESKKELFGCITDIVDESNREGMRAVIRLKKEADVEKVVQGLMKYTNMQTTFGVNMVAIAGGKPKQMGIIEILKYYIDYQRDVIVRRTKFDLDNAKKRMHILEGLLIAIKNIDEVVKIIKTSSSTTEAKKRLRARFELSEEQAQAILDMRLARLTSLEVNKLIDEINELKKLIAKLTAILGSKKLQMETVKDELLAIKKQFKSERRTKIISSFEKMAMPVEEEKPDKKEGILCVNCDGHVKLVPTKNYSMASTNAGDCTRNELTPIALKVQDGDNLYFFTNKGNCVKLALDKLPDGKWRDKGLPLGKIVSLEADERAVSVIVGEGGKKIEGELYFYSANGMVKRGKGEDYDVSKPVYQAFGLKDGDSLLGVEKVMENTTIFFGSATGMCLNCETTDIPLQGRTAGGVKGMNLSSGDKVLYAFQIDTEGEVVVVGENGTAKRVLSIDIDESARYRKGLKIADNKQIGRIVLYSFVKHPYEIGIIDQEDQTWGFNTEEIDIVDGRASKGKGLVKSKGFKIKLCCVHHGKLKQ
ncbi:MAG: DNA topoisomerase 4 subunit A [Clostridia bacterium]|nr:DNA topoisomerase 4 subunit A [Clostridia bacterium]